MSGRSNDADSRDITGDEVLSPREVEGWKIKRATTQSRGR